MKNKLLFLYVLTFASAANLVSGQNVFPTSGNVGIGTTTPAAPLSILGVTSDTFLKAQDRRTATSGDFLSKQSFYDYELTAEAAYIGLRHNMYLGPAPRALTFGVADTTGVGASEKMRITSDGKVGIGTATPLYPLHVAQGGLLLGKHSASGGYTALAMRLSSESDGYAIVEAVRSAGSAYGDLAINPSAGNVGIGTTSPGYKLEVAGVSFYNGLAVTGPASPGLTLKSSSGKDWKIFSSGPGVSMAAGGLAFYNYTDDSYRMVIDSAGNVGIGTYAPQAKLDVAGQVRCTTLLLTSDRHAKAEFQCVDSRSVLTKVATLPLSTWHYTNAPSERHIGPMAQDFKAAFPDLGCDDKHIATVDADGVALASIQALYEMMQAKDSEIAALQHQVSALKTELAGVKDSVTDRLATLEKAMSRSHLQQASLRTEATR